MASTNKLYPPIINGVIPAFYKRAQKSGDEGTWRVVRIAVPFAMNQMVPQSAVKSMCLRLKTVQTNDVVYFGATDRFSFEDGIAYFDLYHKEDGTDEAENLIEGLFYKAQLAYCELPFNEVEYASQAGYFSTVGVTKCISKPSVSIAGFNTGKVNLYNNRYLGKYEQNIEQGDSTEKVYSYNFTITDIDGNIYLTSGEQLHNSNNDINHWSSEDEYLVHKELPKGIIYYIQYTVTTVNGLVLSSPTYRLMAGDSVPMEKQIAVLPQLNYDEGYIEIQFKGPRRRAFNPSTGTVDVIAEDNCSGLYLLSRGYQRDDYMVWEDIARFKLNNELPSQHIERDFTIEQGITYKYRLQQYNLHGVYSNPEYSKEIYADFEDMFLYDGVRQLKVRFNPKVSTFKVDIPEQKIETIGSKYPFIFRNGNVYYHEFPISGLISYQLDEAKLFLNGTEIIEGNLLDKNIQTADDNRTITSISFNTNLNSPKGTYGYQKYNTNDVRMDKDLTSENLMSERYFKLAVLAWLTNGEIKLFRSPGEGNYLVRLLNTSMTPNDTLGRMLHTFNTTAYEIADLTYDNLLQFKLISVNEPAKTSIQSSTTLIDGSQSTVIYESTQGQELYGIDISDCTPGDQIEIYYLDDFTTETITIGVTGSYSYEPIDRSIGSITFHPFGPYDYPRSITLSYIGEQQHYFDLITGVNTVTEVSRTYYGPQMDVVNSVNGALDNYWKFNIKLGNVETAYKTKLLDMEMLRVRAREIIPLYRWKENNQWVYNVTPFGVGYPIQELAELTNNEPYYIRNKIVGSFAIYAVYQQGVGNVVPSAVEHQFNLDIEDTGEEEDHIYNEMYPDWELQFYGDPRFASNNDADWTIVPDMRFAINSDSSTGDLQYVDLTEKREMTLWNLGPIPVLYLGNSVIAETVMRIRVTNYSLEDTEQPINEAKQNYLAAKEALITAYQNYAEHYVDNTEEYNNYIKALSEYEEAQKQLSTLVPALNVVNSLLNNSTIWDERTQVALNNAKTKIADYNDKYYQVLQEYKRDGKIPANYTLPEQPIIDLGEEVTTANELTNILNNSLANVYNTALQEYANLIPDISDFDDFPSGWRDNWNSMSVAQAVSSAETELLSVLNQMYNLLHKQDATINIFTENYYSNKNLPIDDQWETTDGDIVLADQIAIGGIAAISLEDIEDNIVDYHEASQIILDRQAYEDAKEELDTADGNVQTALEAQSDAEEAYEPFATQINRYNNIIAQQQQIIINKQQEIATIRQLIVQYEQEPQTDKVISTLEFLYASIDVANADIARATTTITNTTSDKSRYILRSDVQAALAMKNAADAAVVEARTAQAAAALEVNNTYNQLISDINTWNSDLSKVKSYIIILEQISDLLEINLDDLREQINNYREWYNQLVNSHSSYYQQAYTAIQAIDQVNVARLTLEETQSQWTSDKERLEAIQNPTPVSPPTGFDWDYYISNVNNAWSTYMNELEIAYRDFEARYY